MGVVVRVAAATCVVFAGLAYTTPAVALTLTTPEGVERPQPWQMWADGSYVPTPPGGLPIVIGPCPFAEARGCFTPDPPTIYMTAPGLNRAVFLHEVGHAFDDAVMTDAYRAGFMRIMNERGGDWYAFTPGDGISQDGDAQERFAVAYSTCARARFIRTRSFLRGFGYDPTPAQHRRVCALIRRAAA